MKVNDLMNKEQMNFAYEAGKQLAKMIGNINLAPKQPIKKAGFGAFFQATLPQPLQELSSSVELKEVETELRALFGWQVHCSRHFVERVFDRERDIAVQSILDTFAKLKAKYRIQLARATLMDEIECVVKDYEQQLNIVFVLRGKNMELMTIMLKNPDRFTIKSSVKHQTSFKV